MPGNPFKQYEDHIYVNIDHQGLVRIHVNNLVMAKEIADVLINTHSIKDAYIESGLFQLSPLQYDDFFGHTSYEKLTQPPALSPDMIKKIFQSSRLNARFSQHLIKTYDKHTLEYLLYKTVGGETLLNILAMHSDEKSFSDFINHLGAPIISLAVFIQNNKSQTPLHLAADGLSENKFLQLIKNIYACDIEKALFLSDHRGQIPLHKIAIYYSENILIEIINKLSATLVQTILSLESTQGSTIIDALIAKNKSAVLILIFKKISISPLNDLTLLQPSSINSLIGLMFDSPELKTVVIEKLNNAALHYLLKKLENTKDNNFPIMKALYLAISINKKLNNIVNENTGVFQTSLGNQVAFSDKNLMGIVEQEGFSSYADIELLIENCPNEFHDNLVNLLEEKYFHQALFINGLPRPKELTKDEIIIIFNQAKRYHAICAEKYDKLTFEYLFSKTLTPNRETLLSLLVEYCNSNEFIKIIKKVDPKVVNQSLFVKNAFGDTALHIGAAHQYENAFSALVECLEIPVLKQVVAIQNAQGNTPLHLSCNIRNRSGFITLLSKLEPTDINALLPIQNNQGRTMLHLTAMYCMEKALITLIEKSDPVYLEKALLLRDTNGSIAFEKIVYSKNTLAIEHIVTKISDNTLNTCFMSLDEINKKLLIENMQSQKSLQIEIIKKLDETSLKYILKSLGSFDNVNFPFIDSVLLSKHINDKINGNKHHNATTFKTSKGNDIPFTHPTLLETIKQEGFASYDDIALVIENCPAHLSQNLYLLIDKLHFFRLLLKGGLTPYSINPTIDKGLQEKIENFSLLYKIIAPDKFDNYVKQFKDYHYRPPLRYYKTNPSHKFVHLTGEIIDYSPKKKKHPPKQRIKKNSTTLLSPNLVTPVFGEHHNDDRPLVGLLFDLNQCTIKAMLQYDRGTFDHGWLGGKSQVENYKEQIKNLNYTCLDAFKKAILDQNSLNEVLAEIPKEAIIGIFMRHTTGQSRKTAFEYARIIRQELNLDLPIYHYNREKKLVCLYPKDQLEFLLKRLKENLFAASYDIGFFGGVTYTCTNTGTAKCLPKTAYQIITKIDELLTKKAPVNLCDELVKIEDLLAQSTQLSLFRTQTTVDSYTEALRQLRPY